MMKDRTICSLPYRLGRRLTRAGRRLLPSAAGVLARWQTPTSVSACKAVLSRFRRFCTLAPFGPIPEARERLAAGLCVRERTALLEEAETICSGQLELFGEVVKFRSGKFEWHTDFKSAHKWNSRVHYLRIAPWPPEPGVDVKVPWELSRCHHFAALGLAYWLSDKREFGLAYIRQVEDWLRQNPLEYGVNWACAMDVAIRAMNWLLGFLLFQDLLLTNPEHAPFLTQLSGALWNHGSHIMRNLEWNGPRSPWRANHFAANIAGLFTLGLFFRDTARGRRWQRFAAKAIRREIAWQVHSDGSHFEGSLGYHRLVLEIFLWCRAIAGRSSISLGKDYAERIERMQRFVAAYLKPDGTAPLIGDADDGHLFKTRQKEGNDHAYVSLAEDQKESGFCTLRWLLDGQPYARGPVREETAAFADGGYYCIRGGGSFLMVRAGKLAHHGAHAHCDQLSFVLSIGKHDFFTDRGTFGYSDTERRNLFRSTRSHNTLSINGHEQNEFPLGPRDVFSMTDNTRTKVLAWSESAEGVHLVAEHYGFCRFKPALTHRREFLLCAEAGSLRVTDRILPSGASAALDWYFHLAPTVCVHHTDGGIVELASADTALRMHYPVALRLSLVDVPHSPAYRVEQQARCLQFSCEPGQLSTGPDSTAKFLFEWKRHDSLG